MRTPNSLNLGPSSLKGIGFRSGWAKAALTASGRAAVIPSFIDTLNQGSALFFVQGTSYVFLASVTTTQPHHCSLKAAIDNCTQIPMAEFQ